MRALAVLGLATLLSACGSWRVAGGGVDVAPSGLGWTEERMRRALVTGGAPQAYRLAAEGRGLPDDALLRALFRGQTAYLAGEHEAAVRAFDEAIAMTDARFTRSATRELLGAVVSERARRWMPGRTERLFVHHYAMLARLESGDVEGAAVEARRLSALLAEHGDAIEPDERPTHAALREAAGAVFEAAGEWNDASVAYRNAARLRGADPSTLDSLVVAPPPADSARLVVIVERGFAAHLMASELWLPLDPGVAWWPGDVRVDRRGSAGPRRTTGDGGEATWPFTGGAPGAWPAGFVSGFPWPSPTAERDRPVGVLPRIDPRTGYLVADAASRDTGRASDASDPDRAVDSLRARSLTWLDMQPGGGVEVRVTDAESEEAASADAVLPFAARSVAADWTPSRPPRGLRVTPWWRGDRGVAWGAASWLRVSWPLLVRARRPAVPAVLAVAGLEQPLSGLPSGVVADALAADARRARAGRLARLVTRNAARAALADAVRDKHGELAGFLVGALAAVAEGGADTRLWSTLPGDVTVVRVTVPAEGRDAPELRLRAGVGELRQPLGARPLTAGTVRVTTARIWRDPAGVRVADRARGDPARGS